jgi:ketosteroid isomerase-like protein
MRALLILVATALMIFNLGCTAESESVDLDAEREALLEADRAWATAAAAGDVERLTSFWADDATNYFPGAPVARGKDAIGELVRRNRSLPGFSLSWEPQEAVVARSADLGYTSGTFALSIENPDGSLVIRRGHYVCVWKKQTDGSWKCAVESTIFGPSSGQPSEGNGA